MLVAGSKSLLAHWRETGEWWNGDSGVEVHRWIDSNGTYQEPLTPIDPLVPAKPIPTGYVEDFKEDWDVRIRKQRDIKVSLACGAVSAQKTLTLIKNGGTRPYAPLHILSGYAFGRSLLLAEEVAELVSALECPAAAIADPFSLAGAVEFVRNCQRTGVKALVGASIELADGGEIVLIARNKLGYKNLSILITECHLNEPRSFPLATWDRLAAHAEGLLCLTGGDLGPVDFFLTKNDFEAAAKVVERLCKLYGKQNIFLEVERSFLPWQKRVEAGIRNLADRYQLMAVAGGCVTHARPDHFPAQDVLVCIDSLCLIDEVVGRKPNRSDDQPKGISAPRRALNAERYLRSGGEAQALYYDAPDLLANTLHVASLCEIDVLPERTKLPNLYPNEAEALREIVAVRAVERYPKINARLKGRIDREIDRIVRLGYANHFLVAEDFCRWADRSEILYSGRGSVVDSVVAYCLGLSRIDAFSHNLHFDRFLPEDGSKRPDIDLDFEAAHRDDVREYITQKYGESRVATVAAFGAYCTRGIVREVGKVMGLPDETVGDLCKRLHAGVRPDELEAALDKRPELRGSKIPKERFRWVFRLAQRLMDVPRNVRAHSSGVVISSEPLEWTVPRMWGAGIRPQEAEPTDTHMQIIQWDKRSAKYYFDKFDILCLRGQDVLSGTQRQIRVSDPSFRVESLSLTDESTYRTMRAGQLIGIPQSASPAMRQAHIRLRTQDLQDASLVQAGIRPGVGGAVKINELIARRRGKPFSFSHPHLLRILGHTYGIIVFQEQVDQLLQDFAGYKSGEAEDIRDAIHKKRREGYAEKIQAEVTARIIKNGFGIELANEVYELIAGFQGYGFAQGHALAFAEISIRSIYCQQNFPAPYFAALLNSQPAGYYGPCTIANEARIRGVPILPPEVNLSEAQFSTEDYAEGQLLIPTSAIRVGLNQISGLSDQTIKRILHERTSSLYYSIFDFTLRVRPNRDELETLVLCGALDGMGPNRRALLWAVPLAIAHAEAYGGSNLESRLPLVFPEPLVREDIPDFTKVEKAVRERMILGLDVNCHLMGFERERVKAKGILSSAEAALLPPGTKAFVVGNPMRLRFPPTQSGKRVMFFDCEDETGLLNVTCFDDTYQRYGHTIVTNPYVTLFGEAQDRDGHIAFLATKAYPYRPRIQDAMAMNAVIPIKTSDFLMS